jgi:hypothetical protein
MSGSREVSSLSPSPRRADNVREFLSLSPPPLPPVGGRSPGDLGRMFEMSPVRRGEEGQFRVCVCVCVCVCVYVCVCICVFFLGGESLSVEERKITGLGFRVWFRI